MKKKTLALGLALGLALSGCSSILERSYTSSTAHVDRPITAEDSSVLRVENYRELVSAVLYLVSEGAEEGVIQFHDYVGSVENDLTAACLEVTTQDPLGAYCVDYIKHEYARVVSYYQAALDIHYRRTQEQVRSMVRVTGTGAIRTELRQALTEFAPEVVLRVAYFAEDADFIRDLLRQTYYDAPTAALGFPQADSGRERVVEILLTYPEPLEELRRKGEALTAAAKDLSVSQGGGEASAFLEHPEEQARRVLTALWSVAVYASDGGATAYDALVTGVADSQGLALGYALLASQQDSDCRVVEGERNGLPHFWIGLEYTGGMLYLDPSEGTGTIYTAQELYEAGYRWEEQPAQPDPFQEALAQ